MCRMQVRQAVAGRKAAEAEAAGLREQLAAQQQKHATSLQGLQEVHAQELGAVHAELARLQGSYDCLATFQQASQVQVGAAYACMLRQQTHCVHCAIGNAPRFQQHTRSMLSGSLWLPCRRAGHSSSWMTPGDQVQSLHERMQSMFEDAAKAISAAKQSKAMAWCEVKRLLREVASLQEALSQCQAIPQGPSGHKEEAEEQYAECWHFLFPDESLS